jgi:hypothetical protein
MTTDLGEKNIQVYGVLPSDTESNCVSRNHIQAGDFAIVTPSYEPDFERCRLLVQTVQAFVSPAIRHYLIVSRLDYPRFKTLETAQTIVVQEEDILPDWIRKIPFFKSGWYSPQQWFIRGWVLQQIIKLGFVQKMPESIAIMADSDMFFARLFDPMQFIRQDEVRGDLVRLMKAPPCKQGLFPQWQQTANALLKIPPLSEPDANYVGNLIVWRRDHVQQLCERLETVGQTHWTHVLSRQKTFSEYVLYGTFVDRVLGEKSGHYADDFPWCHEYWEKQSLEADRVMEFFESLPPESVAMMISAKAKIPVSQYLPLVTARF